MIKKIYYSLLMFLMLIPLNVHAVYNGGDGGGSKPSTKSCPINSSKFCAYNNAHHMTVLISLYYFDENGGREQIGKSVIYTNNNIYNISDFYSFNIDGNANKGYNSEGLKNYFYNDINNFITLLNRTKNFGLTKSNYEAKLDKFFTDFCAKKGKDKTNCSESAPSNYGFRILIEPYPSGFIKNKLYFMTPKEIAEADGMTNSNDVLKIYSWLLHTEFTDVGIKHYNDPTTNLSLIANKNSGYGYNIIDFAVSPDRLPKQICEVKDDDVETCCLKYGITTNNYNTNKYNTKYDPKTKEGYLSRVIKLEELYNTKCDKSEQVDCKYSIETDIPELCSSNTKGHIKDFASWKCAFASTKNKNESIKKHYFDEFSNEYCAIYCKEEINYQFPDGSTVVDAGRYLTIKKESINGELSVISPIKYNGVKVCRTTSEKGDTSGKIDKAGFLTDFNNIEEEIKKAFDTYVYLKHNGGNAKELTNANKKYDELVSKRDKMISQINACSTRDITYNFSPSIEFTYEEPVYGGTWQLSKETKLEKNNKYYIGGNAVNSSSEKMYDNIPYGDLQLYECDEKNGCQKTKTIKYALTDWVEKSIKKDISYTLPDDLYRYVRKDYGASVNLQSETGNNFIIISESNLPIHYSTNPGDYDFKIEVTTLGKNNKFNDYIYNKKSFDGKIIYNGDNTYNCSYRVSCKKIINNQDCKDYCNECPDECEKNNCLPDGLTPIYRTISLYENESFLTIDGKIRKPGANWNYEGLVTTFITNNRNVKDYDVYKLDPMYEITLTPSLLKEIREYNKKMNAKKLTIYNGKTKTEGIAGYADFESMTCENNECKSSKLRQWGVEGCAINSSKSFTNCGNTISW